jgi:nitroreductase
MTNLEPYHFIEVEDKLDLLEQTVAHIGEQPLFDHYSEAKAALVEAQAAIANLCQTVQKISDKNQ